MEIDKMIPLKPTTCLKKFLLTARKTIGKFRKKKHPWITNDILDLCDKKNLDTRSMHHHK